MSWTKVFAVEALSPGAFAVHYKLCAAVTTGQW